MAMNSPVHPGSLIREDCLEALSLTVSAAAEQLGVTRQTLSNLVNEKSALTPEMSIRLEKLGWGRAGAWIRLQANYDLAQVRRVQDNIIVYPDAASG
jgi:addiction module HigA family antidote